MRPPPCETLHHTPSPMNPAWIKRVERTLALSRTPPVDRDPAKDTRAAKETIATRDSNLEPSRAQAELLTLGLGLLEFDAGEE